jgi:hypothetical protein
MLVAEIALLGVLFYGVYWLGTYDKSSVPTQQVPETGVRLSQKLHKFRSMGVDRQMFEDIIAELTRRGATGMPFFDGSKPDPEVAAELEMMLEQTPYVPRELNEPGEDRLVSKSTYALWLRGKEEDDG